ncbi:MAG: hypothetical protein FJ293_13590 [Planctomycetes bacterium]|nr:hypothetical protein [Planctomycetota bacterium]
MTASGARPIPVHAWSRRRRLLTGGCERSHPRAARFGDRRRLAPTLGRRLRQGVGYLVLLYGIAGIVLPFTPAVVLIPAGVALIGRDQRQVRWLRSSCKLLLRRAATWPGVLGRLGERMRLGEKRLAKKLRDRRLGPFALPPRSAESNPAGPA